MLPREWPAVRVDVTVVFPNLEVHMRTFVWIALSAAALGCGSGSGSGGGASSSGGSTVPLMAGFDPGPAPDPSKGFQVVLPAVSDISAAGSFEYCSWTDVTLDHDIWVKESVGYQTESGHHIIVYYTMDPQPAGQTRICSDYDMASFRFGVGAGGEGVSQDNKLPGNLAVRIPAGAQIVLNHHYLNAGSADIPQAQSAVNVFYADPSQPIVQSSSLAFIDTSMSLPPGPSSVDFSCTMKSDLATWTLLPHMHGYGTHITIDHVSSAGSDRLFDLDWDPSFTFHPPQKTEDPSQPYVLHAGDQLHLHCDYNNTTQSALTFGMEMCVSYAETVDATGAGNMECDQGSWGPF
jgi:hypothetical protein